MKNLYEMDYLDLQNYINLLRTFEVPKLEEELRLWRLVGQALEEEVNRRKRNEAEPE